MPKKIKTIKELPKESLVECDKCQYEWITKSKMFLVSCPRCGSKVKIVDIKK